MDSTVDRTKLVERTQRDLEEGEEWLDRAAVTFAQNIVELSVKVRLLRVYVDRHRLVLRQWSEKTVLDQAPDRLLCGVDGHGWVPRSKVAAEGLLANY